MKEVPSLCNGDFETGTFPPCWTEGGELARSMVEWLDVGMTYDVAQGALRQFWDIFALEINGEMVFWDGNKVPGTSQQRHDLSWRRGEVNLSPWRGQTVMARFANWNGYSQGPGAGLYNTWTYLDEVQVEP
jgi:hypothetical protein